MSVRVAETSPTEPETSPTEDRPSPAENFRTKARRNYERAYANRDRLRGEVNDLSDEIAGDLALLADQVARVQAASPGEAADWAAYALARANRANADGDLNETPRQRRYWATGLNHLQNDPDIDPEIRQLIGNLHGSSERVEATSRVRTARRAALDEAEAVYNHTLWYLSVALDRPDEVIEINPDLGDEDTPLPDTAPELPGRARRRPGVPVPRLVARGGDVRRARPGSGGTAAATAAFRE